MTSETKTHDHKELDQRIQRLYEAAGAPTGDKGHARPKTWFAEQVGVHPNTVTKWCMDPEHPNSRTPGEPVYRLLDMLEREHDVS